MRHHPLDRPATVRPEAMVFELKVRMSWVNVFARNRLEPNKFTKLLNGN